MKKNNSPYTAAITGGGFLFDETNLLLPLMMSEDSEMLLKKEKLENNLLQINRQTSRERAIFEIRRRYNTVPKLFWEDYLQMNEQSQKIALFYVILKTYKICFDFQINVTRNKWQSISRTVTRDDLLMEFNEIGARDEFVDSWTDNTRIKVAAAYISILRKVGMLDEENQLHAVKDSNEAMAYYIRIGEQWFLEACLLQPYEINEIRKAL
jgi:hypothetical protein